MITATGWTWEYIDEFMDLPRLDALTQHWNKSPPVHISMAAYVGWGKSKNSASGSTANDGEFEQMMAGLPQKVMNPNG